MMKILKWIIGLIIIYLLGLGAFLVFQHPETLSHPLIRQPVNKAASISKGMDFWVKGKISAFQKRREGLDKLTIPSQNGALPTGENIANQWVQGTSRFVFVAYTGTLLYAQPREDALVLRPLKVGERVRVAFLDPDSVTLKGRKTQWVFLTSSDGKKPLGWVLDFQLGYKNRFQRISSWAWDTFEFCKGQYCATYSVTLDGLFELTWSAQGGRLFLEGQNKGKLLGYGELYWAKKVSYEDVIDVFKVNADGELTQECLYEESPIRIVTF